MKKTFLLLIILFCCITKRASSQCTVPPRGTFSNVTTTSASISLTCPGCSGTLLFEYGPYGFIPGTGATAGPGGTVVTVAYPSVYPLAGLTPNTSYSFYTRQNCGATFSANSLGNSFSTLFNCSSAPVVTLNTMVTGSIPSGPGYLQTCYGLYSREIIYLFTPSTSGNHVLFLPPYSSSNPVYFAYAPVSNGCVSTGFTCIGRSESTIQQHSFGPLTAGTSYYLRLSSYNGNAVNNFSFRIERPGCSPPTNITVSNKTPTDFTVTYSGIGGYLEYGPTGFIPGIGSNAGVNGTVISASSGVTPAGLTPNTTYDFYLRDYCGSNNYSNNSALTQVTTMPCPSTANYGSLGTMLQLINVGNYQYGVYGSSHIPGCWPDGYGDEVNVKFTPPVIGKYEVSVNTSLSSPNNPFGQLNFDFRQTNGTCNLTNYVCQSPVAVAWPNSSTYIIDVPGAGVTYDMLFDAVDSNTSGAFDVTVKCASPDNLNASNITAHSASIGFDCNCPNATYLEYGPYGFTPGTGSTAGGGTLLSNVTSPVNLSGLASYTDYAVWIRSSCGGSFSGNTFLSFKTKIDCANAPVLNCGSQFNYDLVNGHNNGLWQNYNCGATTNSSDEKLYHFIPPQSATYSINNIQSAGWGSNPVSVYYKLATGTCDESGWTCLGNLTSSPQIISWGPLTAGTDYMLLFDANGNLGSTTKTIRIDCPAPCSATITPSGATTFCSGGNVIFQANTGAGISYQWYKNGNSIAGATSSAYTANASGLYYVIENRATCGAINSNSMNVTVNALPSATITPNGTLNFCTGPGITLQANTGAGLTYQWRKNSVNIAGATNSGYVANSTGTFNVVVTNSSGCSKGATPVNVTSPPSLTITPSGTTHFCTGGSVTLTAISGQTVTYKWKKNGAYIAGATNSNYVATSTGSYNCVVTNSFGCSKGGTAIAVTGPPSAVITANGPTTFCIGGNVQLSAPGGYTYQWIKNSTNINGAAQQNYTATTAGNYKVKVTDQFGCSKTTPNANQITVSVPCREGHFLNEDNPDITIYPNPSSGLFEMMIPSAQNKNTEIKIYSPDGRLIKKQTAETNNPFTIDLTQQADGIYFIHSLVDGRLTSKKIVKQ